MIQKEVPLTASTNKGVQQMSLEIKTGGHSIQVAPGTRSVILKYLRMAKMPLDHNWVVYAGRRVKGRPHTPEFKPVKVTPHKGVQVRVKPGGNDTARMYHMVPPNGMLPEVLLRALKEAGQASEPTKEGVMRKPEPSLPTEERREELVEELSKKESLAGFTSKVENVQLVLIALLGQEEGEGWFSTEQAREVVHRELRLGDVSPKGLGAIIGTLERRGLLEGERTHSGHLRQVRLSDSGRRLIAGEIASEESEDDSAEAPSESVNVVPTEGSLERSAREIEAELTEISSWEKQLQEELSGLEVRRGKLEKALEAIRSLLEEE